MAGATAPGLAICTLVLLVFDTITCTLRFYVRISRKAWGPDDWSMVAAVPIYIVTVAGQLGIAFNGGGLPDAQLGAAGKERGMFVSFCEST